MNTRLIWAINLTPHPALGEGGATKTPADAPKIENAARHYRKLAMREIPSLALTRMHDPNFSCETGKKCCAFHLGDA